MKPYTPEKSAKYALGRIDTRWHVYPQQMPLQAVAIDWYGFWCYSKPNGFWYQAPASFVIEKYVTRDEAEAFQDE